MSDAPTRTLDVPVPGGRTLHVRDDGEPGDPRVPLVLHHGTPQCGLVLSAQLDDARRRGLRVVSFDRAGYGGSPRHDGRRVADVAGDVAALADALGFDRFVTSGASGAAARARVRRPAARPRGRRRERGRRGAARRRGAGLAGRHGRRQRRGVRRGRGRPGRAGGRSWRPRREEVLAATPQTLVDSMRSLLPPSDVAVLTGELGEWLHASMARGLATGTDGWLDDDLAFVGDWGFSLADVRVPVLVMAGAHDLMVPLGHATWLAHHVPGATTMIDDAAGHLSLLTGIGRVHGWLLDEYER